jgi:phage gp45-like
LNKSGLIDDHLQQQIAKAAKKWREILERITATVQTLAQQNLPLRGHRQSVVSDLNPGIFLSQ